MANSKTVIIKIKRQDTPESKPYWEEFELQHRPGMNVTSALMDIAAAPVTKTGKADDAGDLRLQLPGRGVRLLRHAHQRQGPHGLLGADRSTGEAGRAGTVLQVSGGARPRRRPQRALREPEKGEGLGAGRRIVRSRLRPAPVGADAGRSLSALTLHLVLLLHGGLPAIQRQDRVRRRRHHLAGAVVQHPSHGHRR